MEDLEYYEFVLEVFLHCGFSVMWLCKKSWGDLLYCHNLSMTLTPDILQCHFCAVYQSISCCESPWCILLSFFRDLTISFPRTEQYPSHVYRNCLVSLVSGSADSQPVSPRVCCEHVGLFLPFNPIQQARPHLSTPQKAHHWRVDPQHSLLSDEGPNGGHT